MNDLKNYLVLIAICFLIANFTNEGAQALANGRSKGSSSWFSVSIDEGEEDDSPAVNIRMGGNDRKYRFDFNPNIGEFSNNRKRQGQGQSPYFEPVNSDNSYGVKVQINPRGSSGLKVPRKNVDESSEESNSLEWAQDVQTISPPPYDQVAKMARFIVRNSNWTSLATISTRKPTVGFPFANIASLSDGPEDNSTGVPYMYLTSLELSVIDLKENSKASLTMSLAQGDYCRLHNYDPEDPRCAHVILTGNIVKIDNSTSEADFARNSLFSRHPEMASWPQDHGWFFAKMNILNILVLDFFGGAKSVTPEEYFAADIAN